MKRLLALLFLFALHFNANADIRVTGNDLARDCAESVSTMKQGFCLGFISAVIAVSDEEVFCLPIGSTLGQYRAVVMQFLNNNPNIRHMGAFPIVTVALKQAFPCQGNTQPRPMQNRPTF